MATLHLQPTAHLAERVLLPGDPGRALLLAQALLAEPRMFNHNRGLWGYTGLARDGRPLTIQSTGMGGPSAAIVIAELAELGARTLVRVGTCGALDASLELGDLLVATEALTADGTSRALGAGDRVAADPLLLGRLRDAAGPEGLHGPVVSSDLFYDGPDGRRGGLAGAGRPGRRDGDRHPVCARSPSGTARGLCTDRVRHSAAVAAADQHRGAARRRGAAG